MKYIFDIELVGVCNAKCSFCPQSFNPNGVKREERFWSKELVNKVMNEIREIAIENKSGVQIEFCGIGEPLLKKDLFLQSLEILFKENLDKEYVIDEGKKKPRMDVRLTTNGFYLTEELVTNPLFQRINKIEISTAPTLDKKKYETIYRIDYDTVKKNIMNIKNIYNGKVIMTGVKTKQLKDEIEEFEKFWIPYVDTFDFNDFNIWGGVFEHPADIKKTLNNYKEQFVNYMFKNCWVLKLITFIDSAGYVLPCCNDVESKHKLGNVKKETIKSIISKKTIIQRTQKAYDICMGCDVILTDDEVDYDLDIHKPKTKHKHEYKQLKKRAESKTETGSNGDVDF